MTSLLVTAYDLEFTEQLPRKELLDWVKWVKKERESIVDIQFFKRDALWSETHLKSAVWHAWKAIKENYSISKSISIEFLLYATGQRQISKAVEYLGIDDFVDNLSVVIFHTKEENSFELQNILNNHFVTQNIKEISFTTNDEKLSQLIKLFNYPLSISKTKVDLAKFEKYLLTCVSNLVFEG